MLACQRQNKNTNKDEKAIEVVQSTEANLTQAKNQDNIEKVVKVAQSINSAIKPSDRDTQQENMICDAEVCLQLRNHDTSNKSFEIYMLNSVPIAGFQCDLPGINITGADGGLLQENGYQTSNSTFRILSFSMQAKLIPAGGAVLTMIYYSEPTEEVCMTGIIFAGIGGSKLSNNVPECMQLN